MPDEVSELAVWLERQLVGAELGALVAQLEAVQGERGREVSLPEIVGSELGTVLASGLSRLPAPLLGRLLAQPQTLLELQEMVLSAGGAYWDRVTPTRSEVLTEVVGRGHRTIKEAVLRDPLPEVFARQPDPSTRRVGWNRRQWGMLLAAAASVVAAFVVFDRVRATRESAAAGWGWSRPGALALEGPRSAYLAQLADLAADWFKKRPDDARSLARRIAEFRQGCSTLILADHKPLPETDRAWLVGKCRDWAAKLDEHLRAVEAGQDVGKVRDLADQTIRKLIDALVARSQLPA
jgi:hypothetical protein